MQQEEYEEAMGIIRRHAGPAYVQVRLDHLRFLKGNGTAAVVLAFVLNQIQMKDLNPKDRKRLLQSGLWLRCPAGDMQHQLGMTEHRQRTAIKVLAKTAVIATEKRAGNVLWVKVDTGVLQQVEGGNSRNAGCEDPDPRIPRNRNAGCEDPTCKRIYKENHSRRTTSEHDQGFFAFDRQCADQLREAVRRHAPEEAKKWNEYLFRKWPGEFAVLRRTYSEQVIAEHLAWHIGQMPLKDPYQSIAYCARTFRAKFEKIMAAKKRAERQLHVPECLEWEVHKEVLANGHVRKTIHYKD